VTDLSEAERWSRVKALFLQALDLPPPERPAFVARACQADEKVHEEVLSLLANEAVAVSFCETPAAVLLDQERVPDVPSQPRLEAGTRLGAYEITGFLAAGGMGEVYRARHTVLGRAVAVKTVSAAFPDDAARRRLIREARHAATLAHPNVCTIHEIGEADGAPFIVMELLEGRTLNRIVEDRVPPLQDALDWGIQIGSALDYAHVQGIIHRDLKSSNVVVDTKGRAIVLDFGLARRVPEMTAGIPADPSVTAQGALAGTLGYMAPEVLLGGQSDQRSDVWSLGVLLYELVTGELPFRGRTPFETSSSILNEPPRPLKRSIPLALRLVIERCLVKEPTVRYQRAGEVRDALLAIRHRRAWPVVGRLLVPAGRKNLYAVGAAGVLLVAAGVILLRLQATSGSPATVASPATTIAVLPFESAASDSTTISLAAGLHEAVVHRLWDASGPVGSSWSDSPRLMVIGRNSVSGYPTVRKQLREIAAELSAGTIVTGSVTEQGRRLSATIEVVDGNTGARISRVSLSAPMDSLFVMPGEAAERIVVALGVIPTGIERRRLLAIPRTTGEGYRLYLQGRDYLTRSGPRRANLERAQRYFEQARDQGPYHAEAYAALSETHGAMFWYGYDRRPERAAMQVEAANEGLRHGPDRPEAHFAAGLAQFWSRRDHQAALEEFRLALNGRPNEARTWAAIAAVQRHLGNQDAAAEAFETATRLDPRNPGLRLDLAEHHAAMRRYAESIEALDRALALAPDFHEARLLKGWTLLQSEGQLDTLREAVGRLPGALELSIGGRRTWEARLFLWERKPDSLLRLLEAGRPSVLASTTSFMPAALYSAWAHRLRGDRVSERAAFDSALSLLDSVVGELPNDWRVHAARGLALAGAGRRQAALAEARWLQRSVLYSEDAREGPLLREERARILAQAGEPAAALDEVERLLAGPSALSPEMFRLDPRWDPIRAHPRAMALTLPAEPRLLFVSSRDGNFEIYTMHSDGSEPRRLTDDPGSDNQPRWSPDRKQIVFTSTRDGNRSLYLMNADGSHQRRLTRVYANPGFPDWSPDGKRIVFHSEMPDKNWQIFVMDADGSNARQITTTRSNLQPRWSPDGTRIAYHCTEVANRYGELCVMNADGTSVRQLTTEGGSGAAWSPDGTRIAFSTPPGRARDGQPRWQVYAMHADGSGQLNLSRSQGQDLGPAWSSDGRIYFVSNRSGTAQIWVMDADGRNQRRVTRSPGVDLFPYSR
jgi:TolB-like protein/tetratricopeptide (TPR) repeat protein